MRDLLERNEYIIRCGKDFIRWSIMMRATKKQGALTTMLGICGELDSQPQWNCWKDRKWSKRMVDLRCVRN